jgi:ribosomal protein RSM22 (predicted rRNA methylase)
MDRDGDALRVFEKLARDVSSLDASPIALRAVTADLTHLSHLSQAPQADKQARFHLIVVGFVINELWPGASDDERAEQASAWLTELSRQLTDDGALIVLEPALREQTRQLQRVRDRLAMTQQAPFVFAPCLRSGPCPMLENDRDWCHAQVPFELPSKASEVARLAGLRDHDLTFSYLTLRRQAGHVGDVDQAGEATHATSHASEMTKQRIVSSLLASKGKLELMACGEAGLSRVMRLDRHRTQDNAVVSALRRGAVVNLPVVGEDGRIRITKDHRIETDWHW